MKTTLLSLFSILFLSSAGFAQDDVVNEIKLKPGERLPINALAADKQIINKVMFGKQSITFKVLPGGYVEIVSSSTTMRLSIDTPNKKRISVNLPMAEGMAIWPVENFNIRGAGNFFVAGMSAADEFFTIKPTNNPQGLKLKTPDGSITLKETERLDVNASGKKMSFQVASTLTHKRRPVEPDSKNKSKDKGNTKDTSGDKKDEKSDEPKLPFADVLIDIDDINDAARESY